MEPIDLVIVGAGWYGLSMAKTYLEVNPQQNVILLDDSSSVGGVWSKERVYSSLRTNNIFPTFGSPDFPLQNTIDSVKPGEHIPGELMHQYLSEFTGRYDIRHRIHFGSKVQSAEQRPDDTWLLTVMRSAESTTQPSKVIAKRLVIATGQTSHQYLPHLKGANSFGKPIFHSAHFARNQESLSPGLTKKVAVLGGAKSAWDVVHSYASAGIKVEWIIRAYGNGPVWMAPTYVTPFKLPLERFIFVRLNSWLSPCIWGDADGYKRIRSWFHGTWIGRWLVAAFWWVLTQDVLSLNKYDRHPETKKLKPWVRPFWHGCSLSILNHSSDIFELVCNGMIKVHIADVEALAAGAIKLSNGELLENVDLLCCATGWNHQPSIKFLPDEAHLERSLGLPHYSSTPDPTIEEADAVILKKFPDLRAQPKLVRGPTASYIDEKTAEEKAVNQPYRLFRLMVPPAYFHKRNIAFAGNLLCFGTAILSQTQALWLTAYFAGELSPSPPLIPRPSRQIEKEKEKEKEKENPASMTNAKDDDEDNGDIAWQATLENRFGRWRYPCGFGARYPDFVFDLIPYIDLLLGDLGMRKRRKGSWWKEFVVPYEAADYRGLVGEWLEGRDKDQDKAGAEDGAGEIKK